MPVQASLVARHASLAPRLGARRDDTARGQRARLLAAMAEVVADKGFAAATVADVVRAAGVSRTTFYEQFRSKEDCFVEAYRHGVDVLIDEVRAAVRATGGGWRAQLRAGMRAYLETLAADRRFARTYLLEIHAAGEAALDARAGALRRFAERYRATFEQARAGDPELREPHPDSLLVLCSGTEQLVAECLRRGGDDAALLSLEDVFCQCAEAVLTHRPTDQE
ncbi:MAG TPA: TetR/AcrR family transcriptional regulator [Solirubrobacteraceae bacterium]|nr:TetR/AcrR family transcriptional regulator [Solirubrobacteraceae bacterium]